jgi:RNAse (barnase) inhibitor barstar
MTPSPPDQFPEFLYDVAGESELLLLSDRHLWISRFAAQCAELGFQVALLDGSRMTNREELFAEFQSAFSFPSYFGHNFDALDECLQDLEWLPPGNGYVVVIGEAQSVLRADASGARILSEVLISAKKYWSLSDQLADDGAPVSIPFIVVVDGADILGSTFARGLLAAGGVFRLVE